MKKILLAALALMLLATAGWSKSRSDDEGEEAPKRNASFNLFLVDSLALAGIGGEWYLGNVGLGATFSFLTFGVEDVNVICWEPGAYLHAYLGNIANAPYVGVGATYFSASATDGSQVASINGGLLNVNAIVGYNAFLGDDHGSRFSIEIGPRFVFGIAQGSNVGSMTFFHLQLMYGVNF